MSTLLSDRELDLVGRNVCLCCLGHTWVLARYGRTRCWMCHGTGERNPHRDDVAPRAGGLR